MPLSSKHNQEQGTLANGATDEAPITGNFPQLTKEADSLVEQDIRDRFKRMCEGYFENVSKKLVIEHKVGLNADRLTQ
jgi:regulator of nonsense transcripts 2